MGNIILIKLLIMTTIDCVSNNSHVSTNISTNNTESITNSLQNIKNNFEQNGKH